MADETGFEDQSEAEQQGQGTPEPPTPPGGAPSAASGSVFDVLSGVFDVNPGDAGAVKQFSADTQRVKEMAEVGPAGGGFALSPTAGQKYIDAIDEYLDHDWPDIRRNLWNLRVKPELGDGPYAQRVAEHDLLVMDGDERSLIPNLELLAEGLDTFREAIRIAVSKYDEADEDAKIRFRAVDPHDRP